MNIKSLQYRLRLTLRVFAILVLAAAASSAQKAGVAGMVTEYDVAGLKVIVKQRPGVPTVSAGLFIRGGSRNLTAESAGIENMMLSAATEGSVGYPRESLRRELARTGSQLSSSSGRDFSVLAMSATKENFDSSWKLMVDVALRPVFNKQDVERTRDRIISGLEGIEDAPDEFLQALKERSIYAGTSYANDPDGTIENIRRFTVADLVAYHKRVMTKSQLLLVVVGDLDPESLRVRAETAFAGLPTGQYKDAPLPKLDFSKPTINIVERSLPTNYVSGAFEAPTVGTRDYYAMQVAVTILRDRVFAEVRDRRQLSYAPSASMDSAGANTGEIYVTAVRADEAVEAMLAEVEGMRTTLVEPQELSGVAGQFLTTHYVAQETNAAQASELARYELLGGGWRNSLSFLENIRRVSREDVRDVSRRYLRNFRFVVIGDPKAITRSKFTQQP
ncbi:MAG: insulinase family protein [Acidobacteria bacterium]|nr:insulinase family protein [Acidobacteriota bacterium]MCW5948268.1 insulinase family protein [Pyrinomonadaceae bacterium]